MEGKREPEEVAWVRRRMKLIGADGLWTEQHAKVVYEFLHQQDHSRLFAYLDATGQLHCTPSLPSKWTEVLLLMRDTSRVVKSRNVHKLVQCQVIRGSLGDSMLLLMQDMYLPLMLEDETLRANITKDFAGELDKFMATLTESLFEAKGQTILYIPPVKLMEIVGNQPPHKELAQRLESIVIRWTRQIKEVIRNQERFSEVEISGPLAEVEFWRRRSIDLSGIREQINHSGVAAILKILEKLKSAYLAPFLSLSRKIEQEAVVAEENLKFLTTIEEPCKELGAAKISDIPFVLPKLLKCIRMIWKISPFYNTEEKISGLFAKVSNEIITRCSAEIPLAEIFEGNVEQCKRALQESVQACEAWKHMYLAMMKADAAHDGEQKDEKVLVDRSVFAAVEAFLQRCRDMLEVCDAQRQFSPLVKLPVFGGTRGLEITRSMLELQDTFQKLVSGLRSLSYNLLDVRVARWHDDFTKFKNGIQDLEVLMQNVMFLAFRYSSSLAESIELLEAFKLLACRESICKSVEKMGSQVCAAFSAELTIMKKQFDQLRRRPLMDYSLPRYAGGAIWALQFQRRLRKPMMLLTNAAPYLLETPEAADIHTQYSQIMTSIEQFVQSQHSEWTAAVDPLIAKRLEKSLLDDGGDGFYVLKFDPQILGIFQEVHYWKLLGWNIPEVATDFIDGHTDLRVLRANVLIVIRDCNKMLDNLDPEERGLIAEHVLRLKNCISPALEKLTWVTPKNELEQFLQEVRFKNHVLFASTGQFRAAKKKISQICASISDSWLISIDKKRIYDIAEFASKQVEHRGIMRGRFEKAHLKIKETIAVSNKKCASDSTEVHNKWEDYNKKVETAMENSLKNCVTKSLNELSNALNADTKSIIPMFNAIGVLDKGTGRVRLTPSVQELLEMIQIVARELVTVVSVVPRLRKQASFQESLPSFYEVIAPDQEEILMMITAGVVGITDKVQQYLQYWEKKYRSIWDQDKDAFIRRYERAKKPLSAFESDIMKYRDLQEDVQAEEGITSLRFLRIDCGPLKQAIIAHCVAWVSKFTTLLNTIAKTELESIYSYMEKNKRQLKIKPETLDMLTATVNEWKAVMDERPTIEAKFAPIEEKYDTLFKFEVMVPDDEKLLLENLPVEWEAFQVVLQELEGELEQSKAGFHDTICKMVETFTKEVSETRTSFVERFPVTTATSIADALKFIEDETAKVEAFQQRSQSLWAGMSIFGMEKLSNKENAATMKELELLKGMWFLKKEWQEAFDSWKDGLFSELDAGMMESSASIFSKRVFKIGRDCKGWQVWQDLKETIDAFKSTLPLTVDLRNPAMRLRHWEQLMETVGQKFDPYSSTFTLAKVAELRLDLHGEAICDLSSMASKELAIEESIEKIREVWETMELDMGVYREVPKIYKLKGTEEVFAVLEEHRVSLSSMKGNRAHLYFAKDINKWEKSLSLVSETIEMVVQVQRQWAYLENIFVGSEDIRKQLPAETALFDGANQVFIAALEGLYVTKLVVKALTVKGLLESLIDIEAKLEKIQKSLEDYLEQKRQQFPRFYFLSSDNLLEILGQAKDPRNVQPHFKKCFEGIKRLEMHAPGEEGRRQYDTTGIFSPDGEYLPYSSPIILDTPPEEWLNRVESNMTAAVKVYLRKALEDSKLAKKDKWVKENLGQCIITAGQIKWTADCEKALSGAETSKGTVRKLMKKWLSYLNKLTDLTRSRLSKIDRNKVVSASATTTFLT